jgi:hypothetical protein
MVCAAVVLFSDDGIRLKFFVGVGGCTSYGLPALAIGSRRVYSDSNAVKLRQRPITTGLLYHIARPQRALDVVENLGVKLLAS